MAKKFSGTKLAHGKRAKTDPTFHYDPLDGLFNKQTNHNKPNEHANKHNNNNTTSEHTPHILHTIAHT